MLPSLVNKLLLRGGRIDSLEPARRITDIPSLRGGGAAGHWGFKAGMIKEIFVEHCAELSKKQLIRDLLIRCHPRLAETVKLHKALPN